MKFVADQTPNKELNYRAVKYNDIKNGDIFTFYDSNNETWHPFRNLMIARQKGNLYYDLRLNTMGEFHDAENRKYAIVQGYFQETGLKTHIERK